MQNGLLLINLGTPSGPDRRSVRRYLREFLADKRVITLPTILRYALLYGFILPFRTRKTAKAYQAIWMNEGSPLRVHNQGLCDKLQAVLGSEVSVALGMRYGEPSIADALKQLRHCDKLTILPLYPQYASSATGSAIEAVLHHLAKANVVPSLRVIRDFYQHPAYLHATIEHMRPYLQPKSYVLFSYHGLPEQHLHTLGCQPVCQNECPVITEKNAYMACYRAQCYATTRAIAMGLDLPVDTYQTCFQSRLGKAPWIQPYLDKVLPQLRQKDIRHLTITCPSFVTDCLETLEEIAIRAQAQWHALGGESFTFIPALNNTDRWIDAITSMLKENN